MPRVKRGVTAHARHKKILKLAKGYRGRRKNVYRIAKEAVMKAGQYAYRDRRQRKRQFRTLWIARINAAAREFGLSYSVFMKIGIPKEVKIQEYRVGMVPAGVRELVKSGAKVSVQTGAGLGSGVSDEEYKKAGATIVPTAEAIWKDSEMVIKVKEPLPAEFNLIQNGQKIYTYLHLAVAPELVDVLVDKKVSGIAYETIEAKNRSLPLLKPMSEVAGKMATQVGAFYLSKQSGGTGVLLGGVPGVRRGRVTIIGGGIVGMNACKIAVGMGADVVILDVNVDRLEYLDDIFGNQITTLKSHTQNIKYYRNFDK